MAGGRPTTYDKDTVEKAKDYVNGQWVGDGKIPSIVGLCKYINRSRAIVYDWASHEDKSEFSDILDELRELQERELLNKGLDGEFNSTITKLILTKHGYSDRVDSTHNVTGLEHEDWLDSLDE